MKFNLSSFLLPLFLLSSLTEQTHIYSYFNQCPDGWIKVSKAGGRVIIAEGSYIENNQTVQYSVGDIGGEREHRLTIQEIPNHDHTNDSTSTLLSKGPQICDRKKLRYTGIYEEDGDQEMLCNPVPIQKEGGGRSHNNMQPYLVLTLCVTDYQSLTNSLISKTEVINLVSLTKSNLLQEIEEREQESEKNDKRLEDFKIIQNQQIEQIAKLKHMLENQNNTIVSMKSEQTWQVLLMFSLIILLALFRFFLDFLRMCCKCMKKNKEVMNDNYIKDDDNHYQPQQNYGARQEEYPVL